MRKFIAIFIAAIGLLFSTNSHAGAWNLITTKNALPSQPSIQIKPSPNLITSTCTAPTPYHWQGQCRTCTNPSSAGPLRGTGYVSCEEGFCTNSGLVAFAAIFGGTGTIDVRDCASVPAAPVREVPATTAFGLGTEEYVIGTVAIGYEGQQLGSLKCDPGSVAVGIKVKADNIIRSVTELDCKPINSLSAAGSTSKTPPNPFGSSSGTEASATAARGKALYGFNLHYANELEWDNRLSAIIAGQVNPVEIGEIPKDEYFMVNHEGDSFALGVLPNATAPRVPAVCPKKFFVTGISVLYDSDSVKSVTPTCARVYFPGESPASIPEGTLGLGKWDEVGYLGGRTVSNATVKGWPGYSDNLLVAGYDAPPEEAYNLRICPPGMVMTGWNASSGDIIHGLTNIYCEPIAAAFGSCTNESQERTSSAATLPPDYYGGSTNRDYGRMGCAMTGFEYKQQKWRYNEEVMGNPRGHSAADVRYNPGNTQVVSELHSILGNRMQNHILQGDNFGMGRNAGYCNDGLFYSCDATDWINVMCPSGSFVVGIKFMAGGTYGHFLANLGAYCRRIETGPWTEGTNPAPGPGPVPLPANANVKPALVPLPDQIQPPKIEP